MCQLLADLFRARCANLKSLLKVIIELHILYFQEEKREKYIEELPTKLKLFEDFLGDKPYSAGQKVIH